MFSPFKILLLKKINKNVTSLFIKIINYKKKKIIKKIIL